MPMRLAPEGRDRTYLREIFGIEDRSVDESSRTVELSFSSEAPVTRWGDLEFLSHDPGSVELVRLQTIGVVLWNHRSECPIGAIEKVWIDEASRKGRAVIRFDDDEESELVFRKVCSGTLKGVSVGYQVKTWEVVQAGSTSSNGRFIGPCYVATRWEPVEVSIVSVPADASVGVNRHVDVRGDGEMPGKISGVKITEKSEVVEPGSEANPVGEQRDVVAEATRAERERVSEIQEMARSFSMDLGDLIRDGVSVETARSKVLERLKEERKALEAPTSITVDEKERFRRAARDALLLRSGLQVSEPTPGSADLRGYRLERMAEECLIRNGERPGHHPMEMIGRALTTSDLPIILGDVARVSLMAGWDSQKESYLRWMDDSGVVTDFKEHRGTRAGEVDDLLPLTEGGEYREGSIGEESESWKIGTFGRVFSISRQAIINDALGALTDIPKKMGEAARRKVADVAYAAFLENPKMGDQKDLFCAAHGNLQSGVPFSFSSFEATLAALGAMVQAMRRQKDLAGKRRLDIQPQFLVVPVSLELAARRFLKQTETPLSMTVASEASTASGGGANPYAGAFELISDPRLDEASETAYYLAAAKGKTVKLFFLDGIKEPYLEQQQGWNVDGTSYKIRIDVGAKAMDWRSFQKNPGA